MITTKTFNLAIVNLPPFAVKNPLDRLNNFEYFIKSRYNINSNATYVFLVEEIVEVFFTKLFQLCWPQGHLSKLREFGWDETKGQSCITLVIIFHLGSDGLHSYLVLRSSPVFSQELLNCFVHESLPVLR